MAVSWQMHYDRRVSASFLAHFLPGGAARLLVEYARHAPYPLDLQLRRDTKTGAEHASLYVGLTAVINVRETNLGALQLWADQRWANDEHHYEESWASATGCTDWYAVEEYLESVIPLAARSHASQEGQVQSAVSVFSSHERVMLDREAALHFRDKQEREMVMSSIIGPIVEALQDHPFHFPGKIKTVYGGKCDVLALDERGRLLTVEVKPRNVTSIAWTAAQATVYARLFERWLTASDLPAEGQPLEVLRGMAEQRFRLGLVDRLGDRLPAIPPVVPVIAVQRGVAAKYLDRLPAVQARLLEAGIGHPDIELCEVNMAGRLRSIPL